MSYPYGATIPSPTTLPTDLPFTILQRRQGDVKATLITLTLNGQPINIAGWTFTFSVTLPAGTQTVTWTIQAPSTGTPITQVATPGITIPAFNASVSATFMSTGQFNAGQQLFITGAGVYTIVSVTDGFNAVIQNAGLEGNLSTGTVAQGSNVYQLGQVGQTVMIIPSSITSVPVGLYPFYVRYATSDPSPGPYLVTCLHGELQILPDP